MFEAFNRFYTTNKPLIYMRPYVYYTQTWRLDIEFIKFNKLD